MLAAVYEQMGERDLAADTYTSIVAISPDDAEAWEHLGTWRAFKVIPTRQLMLTSIQLQFDPNRITARFSLAETYLEAERYDRGYASLSRA